MGQAGLGQQKGRRRVDRDSLRSQQTVQHVLRFRASKRGADGHLQETARE